MTTSTVTVTEPEVSAPIAITDPGSSVGKPDSGEGTFEENPVIDEEISSVDETLDLVAGQETGSEDSGTTQETSSTSDGDKDSTSEPEQTTDEEVDDTLSYINAKKLSDSSSNSQATQIAAAFDSFTFDISFDSATVNSFGASSAPTQGIKSDSLSLSANPDESDIFSASNYDLLDLEYRDRSFEEYQSVRKSLENFREQTEQEASIEKTVVGSAIAASTGLSAGYVIWLLRSGALLSSILSSLPAWQLADPLAVLAGAKGREEEDDDTIESIIEKGASQPSPEEKTQHPPKNAIRSESDR